MTRCYSLNSWWIMIRCSWRLGAEMARPQLPMMTSSNGNIFRVTGPLCGEFTGPGEFPTQRPVTRSFDVFFDLRLNKRLSKQPWGWWFETPSWSLWRQCNAIMVLPSYRSRQFHRTSIALQWRYNQRDGVSNHRRFDCLSTSCSGADQR